MRPLPREWHNVHLSWCFAVKARSTGTPKRVMLPSCLHQNPKRRLKKRGDGGHHAARAYRYAPLSESAGPGLGKRRDSIQGCPWAIGKARS